MTIAASSTHFGPITYDDLPVEPQDGLRYELIDGVLIVTPAPITAHQRASARVFIALHEAIGEGEEVFTAPFDWKVSDHTLLQPDLLVVRTADVGPKNLQVPPVLVVEILSPGTRRIDLGLKREAYRDAGLVHYWVVDVDEPSITAFDLHRDETVARAVGDDRFAPGEPVPVSVTPASLIRVG